MVFKPDFSFNPRPVTPSGVSSRSCSPKASIGRRPYIAEDGAVSPSSKEISIISSSPWSSKRSSMTSIDSLKKYNSQPSPSVLADDGLIVSPAITIINEDYESEEEDSLYGGEGQMVGRVEKIEKMKIKEQSTLSINTKTSIFKGFHTFQFHSKRRDDGPSSPVTPVARTPITPVPITPNTRATAHSRFRLFKSAPRRTKNSRRPPPLDLQAPRKISPPFPIRKTNVPVPVLEPAIVLDTSMLAPEQYDFTESPEAGVQLLSQTLEEGYDEEESQEVEHTKAKEEIFRSYSYREEPNHREEITPIYLASPWFDASRGVSPMPKITEVEAASTKFPQTYLPIPSNIFESIPNSPVFSPLAQKEEKATVSLPGCEGSGQFSPVIQPPTPCSTTSSFLFDGDDETDIEDSPAFDYTKKPSIPNSRKSSIATFFCRGQNGSCNRHDSIGLGGLNGEEVEIIDDAESIYYPGIKTLKTKTSWLHNSPPENYSSDEDEDSDTEETYHKHLSLAKIHRKSITSLTGSITSTPELMLSSVSSVSSYGQMLSTPPRRRDRRRTASSDCMVLEALEGMQAAGLEDMSDLEKSKGLRFFGEVGITSEWADTLWEMDADEQVVGWDWETQQVSLIGIGI